MPAPTLFSSSPWLNQVERLFALITAGMIRRGSFHGTHEPETAIYEWLANWNGDPIPFVWKASADVIPHKMPRCIELTETVDQQESRDGNSGDD